MRRYIQMWDQSMSEPGWGKFVPGEGYVLVTSPIEIEWAELAYQDWKNGLGSRYARTHISLAVDIYGTEASREEWKLIQKHHGYSELG